VGYENWLLAYKTRNISETRQNTAKVTINCHYNATQDLSVGGKMYDLEMLQ